MSNRQLAKNLHYAQTPSMTACVLTSTDPARPPAPEPHGGQRDFNHGAISSKQVWPLEPWRPREFFRWPPRTAADTVVPSRSKVEATRLAFGTGTNSGGVQAALGQQGFTRLIRYAYDRGIRFFGRLRPTRRRRRCWERH